MLDKGVVFNISFTRFDVSAKKRLYRGFLAQRSQITCSIVDVVLFKVEAGGAVITDAVSRRP